MKQEEIKKIVRERYASVARESGSCSSPATSCCTGVTSARDLSKRIGYDLCT
jgi:Cdc6-like AAA superfamily ATPase